jgi:hypothetical protein
MENDKDVALLGTAVPGAQERPPSTASVRECALCERPMSLAYYAFGRSWICNRCGVTREIRNSA